MGNAIRPPKRVEMPCRAWNSHLTDLLVISDAMNLLHPILPSSAQGNRVSAVNPNQHGAFVISLDFELHWGVRDHRPLSRAECSRLLAARAAVPRILDLFEEFSISATWATVGMLFARSRDEAHAFAPYHKPNYSDSRLDPFREQFGKILASEFPFERRSRRAAPLRVNVERAQ